MCIRDRAYRIFNRSSLTIEESIHVKFEESNSFVNNVVEIDSLDEGLEKVTLEDTPTMGDKPKDDDGSEAKVEEAQGNKNQTNEVEPTQQLSKDWRYNPHHPKDLWANTDSSGSSCPGFGAWGVRILPVVDQSGAG